MAKYAIGIDFGTLSARAVLVDVTDGQIVASAARDYAHGVMDRELPGGEPLPGEWALQHPGDYLQTLRAVVRSVVEESGAAKEEIAAIGLDLTSSTVLPVDEKGVPLCFYKRFRGEKHAYVKLWKHHGAAGEAALMTQTARRRGEPWLEDLGGALSGESGLPKLLELLRQAPEVYKAAREWTEAGDWVVRQLTGRSTRCVCSAGFKYGWKPEQGLPSRTYFAAVDPAFAGAAEKMSAPVGRVGTRAGGLTGPMAEELGLLPGTAVAHAMVDAHAAVPAAGILGGGQLLIIVGTSTCHMVLGDEKRAVPGISGVVKDAILPGLYAYEAGQSCVGDMFSWFAENCAGAVLHREAAEQGMDAQTLLSRLAARQKPGESGLLVLDWMNGNRCPLGRFDLSGLILGLTLRTRPEDIYRALLEATAYGGRQIVENFRRNGVPVERIYAAGGVSQKNALAMQIYADVLNMPVRVAAEKECGALGSAIYGASAAGVYSGPKEAAERMACRDYTVYIPQAENARAYGRLYEEYLRLSAYFGQGEGAETMARLHGLAGENAE